MRKFWRILAIVLIGVSGFFGVLNTIREFGDERTVLQISVAVGVALYGVLGLIGAAGMIGRRAWCVPVAAAWGVAITYVSSVASFAFHDPAFQQQGTLLGVLGSGVACALIGWYMVWAARESARPVILQQ